MLDKQGELGTLAILDIKQEQCGNMNLLTRVQERTGIRKKEVISDHILYFGLICLKSKESWVPLLFSILNKSSVET